MSEVFGLDSEERLTDPLTRGPLHRNTTSWSFAVWERSNLVVPDESATIGYQSSITESEGNTPERRFVMLRDLRMSAHLDTKSIVDLDPSERGLDLEGLVESG